jgi:hypothetical protein
VLVVGGEREGGAVRDEARNDNRPGSREQLLGWRAPSRRGVRVLAFGIDFSPVHLRALSGATLGVNRKTFNPYYPLFAHYPPAR